MLFTVISFALIPFVVSSVNPEKITLDNKPLWNEFLKDHPKFRCFAVWQNITLPTDDKVLASCIYKVVQATPGKPLFNGQVDTKKITSEYERTWHKYLIEQPRFRCFAAKLNLLLPVDYEVPSYCITRNDSSSTLFNNKTNIAQPENRFSTPKPEKLKTSTAFATEELETSKVSTAGEPDTLTTVTAEESDALTADTTRESDTSTIPHDERITTFSVVIYKPNDSPILSDNSITTKYAHIFYITTGAFVTTVLIVALINDFICRRKFF